MMCNFDKLIVSLDEFNNFTENFEDSKDTIIEKARIIKSAQEVVEEFLGYSVFLHDCKEHFSNIHSRKIYLHCFPVEYVNNVILNGKELAQDYDYTFDRNCVFFGKELKCSDNIFIEYSAGYTKDNVPALIKQTVLRIASLMLMEAGENIGLTSKSFSDNSRSFLNYTNYSKYLDPLRGYKNYEL